MDACVEKLSETVLCRDLLIKLLYGFLSPGEEKVPSIFIQGDIGTGKSLVVKTLLDYLGYNYSILHCIEAFSNKHLFEKIILDLSSKKLSYENEYKIERKCDNNLDFLKNLRSIYEENEKTMVIVLEGCHKLRDMDENLLPFLIKLREFSKLDICTIFISNISWEKFREKIPTFDPVVLHFPQYNKDELYAILKFYKLPDQDEEMFDKYLQLFLHTFLRCCNDLNELRYMCQKNFFKYIEPVKSGIVKKTDSRVLWNHLQPSLRESLNLIYLRVSADDFDKENKFTKEMVSTENLAMSFELPFYSKYLLIAAFLASYNPQKEDKRLFVKEGSRRSKKKAKSKVSKKADKARSGPKSFAFNRMLNIFAFMTNQIGHKVSIDSILLSQVPALCSLGLLSAVGENIDEPKYKCCVGFDFIKAICKNVNFEIKYYLYDYQQ